MERLSVKKPFTVLVAVIIIIALGAVSLMHLSMDLLPEMSLPYMIVVTAYPGASPEKVESMVTIPLENALGTVNGVASVSSVSSDNVSMVQLEFEDGTDMDSAMVKVSGEINQLKDVLPEEVSTPSIMEISMNMIATQYVAIERDGYDQYQLTDFVNDEVIPYISRQDGVASISTIGMVEKSVIVELNQKKIDDLNDRILEETNDALAEAHDALDEAQVKLDDAKDKLNDAESSFGATMSEAIFGQIDKQVKNAGVGLKSRVDGIISMLKGLKTSLGTLEQRQNESLNNAQQTLTSASAALEDAIKVLEQLQAAVDAAQGNLDDAQGNLDAADPESPEYQELLQAVADARAALDEAKANFDEQSEEVAAAQAAYDQAVANLQAAAGNVVDPAEIAALQQQLQQIIDQLTNQSGSIDSSSLSSLLDSSRRLLTTLNTLNGIITQIKAVDPAGMLSGSVTGLSNGLSGAKTMIDGLPQLVSGLQAMASGLTQGQLDAAVAFSTATINLQNAQVQLDAATEQYEQAKEQALENANADALLSISTLSSIVYAQNFAMPAGYIDDENDNSWLLKIGEEYDSDVDIADTLLLDNDVIGEVRLSDVADITIIDNANDSYAKLNGSHAVILSIFKSSSSGTNDVAKACNKAFDEIEKLYPGTHHVTLVDQGNYITMIVESIFTSIGLGALLAIIVLALFLKDIKPTIVVAISIPLSVLLAMVLLYFTGLELNMMTLSGLSLGIGMLVDNSVVVMENIFRLRSRGMSAARAAVQGAKQVRGSIIASTLTTICVFLPSVFASGTVKELLYPLALSIGYCLVASLFIALTVVPASCSTLMKNTKTKDHKIFDKVLNVYGKTLRFCLRFKFIPLTVAIVLLAVTVVAVLRSGIVYIPEMSTNEININIVTNEELTREESYETVDEVMEAILSVDGIEEVGVMDAGSTVSMLSAGATSSSSYGSYMCYGVAAENIAEEELDRINNDIVEATKDFPCEIEIEGGGMSDMSAMMGGSGLSITVSGKDLDKLLEIGGDLKGIIEKHEGFTDVGDGSTEGEPTLHLIIDRDEAMRKGFTVAQVYAAIASRLSTSVKSTTITVNGIDMTVTVSNETEPLTYENILDMELSLNTQMMGMASQSPAGGMSGGMDMSAFTSDDDEDEEDADTEAEENEEEDDDVIRLGDIATIVEETSESSIRRSNLTQYITVNATTEEGYNTTLLLRDLQPELDEYEKTLPDGYSISVDGETSQVNDMVKQMLEMAALAFLFIYLIMVAQFQSLLSPFIILFTIPLAFTGGMLGLIVTGQPLSMLSLLGFVILMGTVVNNGIVFVDYANQLRMGGLERREALVATGITRMRPILMTALTTILAMTQMIFGSGMASQLGSGMAVVIAGGLLYATLMTLYIVPVIYDIFFKRQPLNVDVGSEVDEAIDDAAEYLQSLEVNK